MSLRHVDNWSHPGHYLVDPYTIVTKWSWSWPWMTYCHHHCATALRFWDTAISKFDHENPWSRSCVRSICLLFISWQSDHLWMRYSKFYIWPRKFKVRVMANVKPDGHIWALEFNRYVCFSFRGNRTIFGWDIAYCIFDLENSRSRSWPRSNPMVTFEP